MSDFKVGDIVWYFANDLLVRCTIVELDDQWRKKHGKAGVLYYVIDEPVGHSVSDFEITYDFDAAVEAFRKDYDEHIAELKEEGMEPVLAPSLPLQESRERTCRCILATHLEEDDYGKTKLVPQEWIDKLMERYPQKEHNKDWFGWEDICVKR